MKKFIENQLKSGEYFQKRNELRAGLKFRAVSFEIMIDHNFARRKTEVFARNMESLYLSKRLLSCSGNITLSKKCLNLFYIIILIYFSHLLGLYMLATESGYSSFKAVIKTSS